MNAGFWTLVDGHVHVHPQFSASRLLDAAAANLGLAAERLHSCRRCVGVLAGRIPCGGPAMSAGRDGTTAPSGLELPQARAGVSFPSQPDPPPHSP
jgi:hypothetical protein